MGSQGFNILNYGAGAVGLGLDSFLIKESADVTILARPKTLETLKTSGLKRSGIFGETFIPPSKLRAFATLAKIPAQRFDYILVSTKSFDSLSAAQDLKAHPHLWNKNTKIILCQNGWGNAEIFQKYFPKKQIFNARIITGFERTGPNDVAITVHADAVHLGSLFFPDLAALEPLAKIFSAGGLPTQTTADIAKDLWAKMLYNCALNPLGAIFNVPYGELGKSACSRQLMHEIMTEIFAVMSTAGFQTYFATVKQYEKAFYEKFLPPTAQHRSSTLQDLKKGKRTEIDALNGIIVLLAKKYRIPVPANQTIYQMIKFLEEKNLESTKG